MILSEGQKHQFSEILETLGETLDITETQYNTAVSSYKAVGEWLAKPESSLSAYSPEIRPQGSFMLGTMIKSINEKDDLDIDLVCELTGKNPQWTQYHLKQIVGNRLKDHITYNDMLDKEGRRCWTLRYADSSNYHLDILPSLVCHDYKIILERTFSATAITDNNYDSLAIRITDKEHIGYMTDPVSENWMKSNPFGYAKWFFNEAVIEQRKTVMLSASVSPVPKYQKEKLPLQRIVQILKRHRDMMFNGSEDKPISIIITTLASRAYKKESSVIEALTNVVTNMHSYIETRLDPFSGKYIKWIANPVNPEENFADKWADHPLREQNFYKWLQQVQKDIEFLLQQQGIHRISAAMSKPFGETAVNKTFSVLAERNLNNRQNGDLKMNKNTGVLNSLGTIPVLTHNFHGKD